MTRTKFSWRRTAPLTALFGAWMLTTGAARADITAAPENMDADLTPIAGTPFVQDATGYAGTTDLAVTPPTFTIDEQNAADELFMTQAAQGNLAEISAAQLALERSQNPDVRQLAQTIIDDHTAANLSLEGVFANHGLTLPASTTTDADTTYNQLANTPDYAFDQAFVAAQLKAHNDALALYRQGLVSTVDPQARDYVANTIPTINAHLETILALSQQLNVPGAGEVTDETMLPAMGYNPEAEAMAAQDIAYNEAMDYPNRYDSSSWGHLRRRRGVHREFDRSPRLS